MVGINLPPLSGLNHEIENLNTPITSKEIELVIRNLPTNESLGPDSFHGELHQISKKQLINFSQKCFQKIEEEMVLPNSFL